MIFHESAKKPNQVQAGLPAPLVWGLLTGFFFFLFLRPITIGDIWFLFLAGAETLATGHVPHQEFFLYTSMGAPELFGGWGFGLLAELARRAWGLSGVSYFNAIIWSLTFVISFMAARIRAGRALCQDFALREIVAFLFAAIMILPFIIGRTSFRPEATLYLIWSVGVLLFEHDRYNRTQYALFLFPCFAWVEAWLHTAGVLLILLPIAYAAEQYWELGEKDRRSRKAVLAALRPWVYSCCAITLLPTLNPNGVAQVYFHLALFLRNLQQSLPILSIPNFLMLSGGELRSTSNITEFMPVWAHPGVIILYKAAAIFTLILFIAQSRRLQLSITALPIILTALLHVRAIGLWGLVLLTPLSSAAVTAIKWASWCPARNYTKLLYTALIMILSVGLYFVAVYLDGPRATTQRQPLQFGLISLAEAAPRGGNVFATPRIAPIIPQALGRKYLVSNAGHVMFLDAALEQHFATLYEASDEWQSEIKKYNILAFVGAPTEAMQGRIIPVFTKIAYDPEWQLAAVDSEGLTYLKRGIASPPQREIDRRRDIKTYWLRIRSGVLASDQPDSPPAQFSLRQAERELQRIASFPLHNGEYAPLLPPEDRYSK